MAEQDRSFVVVGLGEILWDLLPDGKQLGGAPANFAYHAHALGAESYVVSGVGDDHLGKEIFDRLSGLKLDSRYISVDKEHPTGTVDVQLDERGHPKYVIHENVAWDFIPFTEHLSNLAARTDALCFGSLGQRSSVSKESIRQFINAASTNCLRVFDINLRQSYFDKKTIHELLEVSNILKLNDEELPVVAELLGLKGAEPEILEYLLFRYQLPLIVLTRGANGSLLYARSRVSTHQGLRVEVADTVGAGDAFTAAIVMGMLRGDDLERINANANSVAAYVCTQSGATPIMPAGKWEGGKQEN